VKGLVGESEGKMEKVWWLMREDKKFALVLAYECMDACRLAKMNWRNVSYAKYEQLPDLLLLEGYGVYNEFIQH
jgi:hypothetical protein